MRETSGPIGYTKKPLMIYFISAFLIINPLLTYIFTLYQMNISDWYTPNALLAYVRAFSSGTWVLLGATWASALGLLFVNRFSLYFAVASFSSLFAYNLIVEKRWVFFALALPAYFLFTHFRTPYLNRRLRWWEQAPRFDGSGHYIRVLRTQTYLPICNISLTGILIDTQRKMKLPLVGETFSISIDERTEIPCEVVRVQGTFLGLRFKRLSQAQKRSLKTMLARLTTPARDLRIADKKFAA